MSNLSDIANVTISLQSTGVSKANFGTPLIVGPLMSFSERVRKYESYNDAVLDDLPTPILAALSDCFGQTPRPQFVKCGRRAIVKGIITVTELIALATYSFKVGAATYSFVADASPTASEIVVGLAAVVTGAIGEVITATVSGDNLEIAYIGDALDPVIMVSHMKWVSVTPSAAGNALSLDLTAMLAEDYDWYGLILTERVEQLQLDAAAWIEANNRMFFTASSDPDCLDPSVTDDLISQLQDLRYYRTAVLYHDNAATEYPDAAWAGRVFTIQPGAETWALKQLGSITPSRINATQKSAVYNKGGNTFEFYQTQLALTNPGKVAAGEWIDVIRFRDWLQNEIQVDMVTMMVNRDKIPYTDKGIQLCANSLRKSLASGIRVGGIAPDELDSLGNSIPSYIVTVPRSVEISAATKASRILYLGFTARLAGAIHLTDITGMLSYEL